MVTASVKFDLFGVTVELVRPLLLCQSCLPFSEQIAHRFSTSNFILSHIFIFHIHIQDIIHQVCRIYGGSQYDEV